MEKDLEPIKRFTFIFYAHLSTFVIEKLSFWKYVFYVVLYNRFFNFIAKHPI